MSPFFNAVEHHRERSTSRPTSASSRHNATTDGPGSDSKRTACMPIPKYPATIATTKEDGAGERRGVASGRCEHCDGDIIPADARNIDQIRGDGTLGRESITLNDLEKATLIGLGVHSLPGQITKLDSTRATFTCPNRDDVDENAQKSCLMPRSTTINEEVPALVPTTLAAA